MPSEVTYFGMQTIMDAYLKAKYPGKQYGWEIQCTQKNVVARIPKTIQVNGQYIWRSPPKHHYRLIIKDALGYKVFISDPVEGVRSNAFRAADYGVMIGSLKEIEE